MLFALLITWTVVFVIIVFGIPQQSPFLQRKKPDWTTNWSSFQLLYLSPLKLKVLFFAHFFGYGAYLLITVYATSWVGISVSAGAPLAEKFTLQRRVFERGVSWGAFGMLLSALVSMTTSLLFPYIRGHLSDGFIWGISQLIAAIALLITSRISELRGVFIILPLCGFAFSTVLHFLNELLLSLKGVYIVKCTALNRPHSAADCPAMSFPSAHSHSLPYLLRMVKNLPHKEELLHMPTSSIRPWEEVTALTSLAAQVVMFSVVPSLFLLRPESDDNKWGMVTAGVSSLLGSLCAFLA